MTHPLTDEMLCEMTLENWSIGFTDDNMRAAYDKGDADRMEQVIRFLKANKDLSVETALRFIGPAMRQQEDN